MEGGFETKENKKEGLEVLLLSFLVMVAIGFFHFWALEAYFYWTYWWFDMIMHFLGGLCVASGFLWLYFFSGVFKKIKPKVFLVLSLSLGITFFVGVLWEVFEFFVWQTFQEPNFITDTTSDILLDILGGLLAYRYFTFTFNEELKTK